MAQEPSEEIEQEEVEAEAMAQEPSEEIKQEEVISERSQQGKITEKSTEIDISRFGIDPQLQYVTSTIKHMVQAIQNYKEQDKMQKSKPEVEKIDEKVIKKFQNLKSKLFSASIPLENKEEEIDGDFIPSMTDFRIQIPQEKENWQEIEESTQNYKESASIQQKEQINEKANSIEDQLNLEQNIQNSIESNQVNTVNNETSIPQIDFIPPEQIPKEDLQYFGDESEITEINETNINNESVASVNEISTDNAEYKVSKTEMANTLENITAENYVGDENIEKNNVSSKIDEIFEQQWGSPKKTDARNTQKVATKVATPSKDLGFLNVVAKSKNKEIEMIPFSKESFSGANLQKIKKSKRVKSKTKICTFCGAVLKPGQDICPGCGSKL